MPPIGSLTADLKLESAAFIRDLKKAADATARNTSAMQRSVAGLQKGFAAAANTFKGFVAGFASVTAVRSLATLAKTAINTGDDIATAAVKLGIAADKLQRFQFAAEQADVSVADLETAITKFSAQLATGKISAQGKDIAEQFRNFIEQIAQAPSHLEKVRIAQEGLGVRQFQIGILLAAQGVEEFNRQLDQTHTISDRALASAGELDNQIRAFQQAISAGFNTGFLEAFAGGLDDTKDGLDTANAAAKKFGEAIGGAFKFIAGSGISLSGAIASINRELEENLPEWAKDFLKTFSGQKGPIEIQVSAAVSSGSGASAAGGATVDVAKAVTAAQKEQAEAAREATEANRAWLERLAAGAPVFEATRGPFEEMRLELENLSELYRQGSIDAETFGRAQTMAAASAVQPWLNVASTIGGALGQLFDDNKAVAIAQAIINTAQGVTAALAQYPPPLSFAMAAAQAAAGAVQIATIKSSKPGSSGSAKRPAAGGGSAAKISSSSSTPAASSAPQRAIYVNLQGSGRYTRDEVFGLIEQLVEAQKDGAQLVLSQP